MDKHPSLILNNGEQHTTKLYELGCTPSTVVLYFTVYPNGGRMEKIIEKSFAKLMTVQLTLALFIPLE
jgi:hypothetical protein